MACAGLFNLCKERNLPLPMEDDHGHNDDEHDEMNQVQPLPPGQIQGGLLFRDHIANLHFR